MKSKFRIKILASLLILSFLNMTSCHKVLHKSKVDDLSGDFSEKNVVVKIKSGQKLKFKETFLEDDKLIGIKEDGKRVIIDKNQVESIKLSKIDPANTVLVSLGAAIIVVGLGALIYILLLKNGLKEWRNDY